MENVKQKMILIVYLSIFNYPGKSMCLSKNRSETHSYIHGNLHFICVKIQIQTDTVSEQNILSCCVHLGTYVTFVYLLVSPLSKVYARMDGQKLSFQIFAVFDFQTFGIFDFQTFEF